MSTRAEERNVLRQRCKEIKKQTRKRFDCRASLEALREFVAEHESGLTVVTENLVGSKEITNIIQDVSRKSISELDEFCRDNEKLCTDDTFWRKLFRLQFPDVFPKVKPQLLPDREALERRADRKWLPWRALYHEMIAVTSQPELLEVIESIINQSDEDSLIYNSAIQNLIANYEILNFFLMDLNPNYKILLFATSKNYADPSLLHPKDMKKMLSFLMRNRIRFNLHNFVVFLRLLKLPQWNPPGYYFDLIQYFLSQLTDRDDTDTLLEAISLIQQLNAKLSDGRRIANISQRILGTVNNEAVLAVLLENTRARGPARDIAIQNNNLVAIRMFLTPDPSSDAWLDDILTAIITLAVEDNKKDIVRMLLTEYDLPPNTSEIHNFVCEGAEEAVLQHNGEILELFLSDSRVEPCKIEMFYLSEDWPEGATLLYEDAVRDILRGELRVGYHNIILLLNILAQERRFDLLRQVIDKYREADNFFLLTSAVIPAIVKDNIDPKNAIDVLRIFLTESTEEDDLRQMLEKAKLAERKDLEKLILGIIQTF